MKITEINVTIELNRDENGYSNNLYVNCKNGNVEVSRPYQAYHIEQAIAIEQLVLSIIDNYKDTIKAVDSINKDLKLDEYAVIVPEEPKASESASSQSCALGNVEISKGTNEETKTLAQQIEDNVIESLGLK